MKPKILKSKFLQNCYICGFVHFAFEKVATFWYKVSTFHYKPAAQRSPSWSHLSDPGLVVNNKPEGKSHWQLVQKCSEYDRLCSLSASVWLMCCAGFKEKGKGKCSYVFTLSNGCILSTGRSKGFLLFRFSIAAWASLIAHLSIGWGKVFCTRSCWEGKLLFIDLFLLILIGSTKEHRRTQQVLTKTVCNRSWFDLKLHRNDEEGLRAIPPHPAPCEAGPHTACWGAAGSAPQHAAGHPPSPSGLGGPASVPES